MRRFVQAFADPSAFSPPLPWVAGEWLASAPARYNIGKGDEASVLIADETGRMVAAMRWGLVPSWEPAPETHYSTQTARLEHAPASRLYRSAWASRRCVVPMSGYYKWDRESRPRQPYFIQAASGQVLFAAGLWSLWGDPSGRNLRSFSILTHPNPAIPAPLTADGPWFLPPAAIADWIAADARAASRLLLRLAQPVLEAYPVTRRVADRRSDDYALLEPVALGSEAHALDGEEGGDDEGDED